MERPYWFCFDLVAVPNSFIDLSLICGISVTVTEYTILLHGTIVQITLMDSSFRVKIQNDVSHSDHSDLRLGEADKTLLLVYVCLKDFYAIHKCHLQTQSYFCMNK